MALFLDSSIPEEIRDLFRWGVFSGVTTNPLILSREAPTEDLEPRIRSVLDASAGPVSVELMSEGEAEMLEEAARYAAWDRERVCIKVPFSEAGLRVVHELARRGTRTNVTCTMSFNQCYLAALAGASYASLFAGRVRDMGYDVWPIVESIRKVFDREATPARLLVGSIRHAHDVTEALSAGAHVVTVPPAVARNMLNNPQTELTIRQFNDAWKNRRGE
ncbi:MAG TPA: transaldolase family protein [Polyangiaceae bacterium]|jgi:transaldolase